MTTDYEYKTESAEAMLQMTFCQSMLKNLFNKFKTASYNQSIAACLRTFARRSEKDLFCLAVCML